MYISENFLRSQVAQLSKWDNVTDVELIESADSAGVPTLLLPIVPDGTRNVQDVLLCELQNATIALFPAWLPEAAGIDRPGGGGRVALKTLALANAARSELFGPYLAAMADAALHGNLRAHGGTFAPETIIRECHKLFCRAYGVGRAALVLHFANDPSDDAVAEAQQAALFIADQQAFLAWLTGAGLERFQRIPFAQTDRARKSSDLPAAQAPLMPHVTPLSGRPNPLSEVEKRLEAFLCRHDWATGRAWNVSWSDGILSSPIRVDLLWEAERLVVEIDGPDHLEPTKYARDRQRDRALQMAGFRVLRFTNGEVAADIARLASTIGRFLAQARG